MRPVIQLLDRPVRVTASDLHREPADDEALYSLGTRDRLVAALDGRLRAGHARELHGVTIEALADGATVSRATAYRYFGNKDQLRAHAAQLLVARHAPQAIAAAELAATAAGKIAAGMTFWRVLVSRVDLIQDALVLDEGGLSERQLRQALLAFLGPIVSSGQADGQLRADVPTTELVGWLIEQQLVLIRTEMSEPDAERWIRRFVLPGVREVSDPAPRAAVLDCLGKLLEELSGLEVVALRAQTITADSDG